MESKKFESKCQQKYKQAQEEIITLNFTKQNEELSQKGFSHTKKNLKLLKQFNGDLTKVLAQLEHKQLLKQQRQYKKLASLGLVDKNEKLINMGYTNIKQNLRCLRLSNNELEGAIQKLQQKRKTSDEIPDLHAKCQELIKKGYKNYKRNQKILKKCDGNIEEAIKFLSKKGEKKELKRKVKEIAGEGQLVKDAKEINYQGKTLYLDGNNILFTDDRIRTAYLKKNRQSGEKMLEALAIRFCQHQKISKLILIFDGKGQKQQQNLEQLEFIRTFAESESCSISDDYLANQANQLNKELKEQCIFVTSDRELIDRIVLNDCKLVVKSNGWMKIAKEVLGEEEVDKILNVK